jgi:hypothetical protein
VSMGGRAEGLACADLGVRTPIGASVNFCVPARGFMNEGSFINIFVEKFFIPFIFRYLISQQIE